MRGTHEAYNEERMVIKLGKDKTTVKIDRDILMNVLEEACIELEWNSNIELY